jgi:hypothetical protein
MKKGYKFISVLHEDWLLCLQGTLVQIPDAEDKWVEEKDYG